MIPTAPGVANRLACVLLLALPGVWGADAGALPAWVSVAKYPVTGATRAAIRQDLERKGPVDATNRNCDALTWWHIKILYPRSSGTSPVAPDVTLKVLVALPELTPRDSLDAGLLGAWDGYVAKLTEHEAKHVDLASRCRDELAKTLATTTPSRQDAAAKTIIESYQKQERDMDAVTDHGRKDGVSFR